MEISYSNDVKIYNLSAGKTLPTWLSEKKKRNLSKKHLDIRRRIELIQDFDMPDISSSIRLSRDGQYVFATGIYKPRVKCFDVNQLSLKFERCFDSEVITFEPLADDYSKLVFLHCDRYVEFHAAFGKYYRLRIPRYGRDLQYHAPSCDLFIVGNSNEIYRLNLERGKFLPPYISGSTGINKCAVNPVHHYLLIGNDEGKVEAWDPRGGNKIGTLDCAFNILKEDSKLNTLPSITALKCDGALTMGVGTASGHVLLYDIRSNSPFLVKDHMYDLPIKNIEFHKSMDLVYSMDSRIIKIWEKQTGNLNVAIESKAAFNDLCVVPDTGMFFIANESIKMQTYYVPTLGPAPRWCGFLDSLIEELEEQDFETIYDDYKFVTEKELDELGLSHLKGTNLLRAYMHGHFMDIRLYRKARDLLRPFEFDAYKKKKLREKIEEERPSRVHVNKLPTINKDLALKMMEAESGTKKKKHVTPNLLADNRFKALFENPDFEVDKDSEEFRLINPVISQMGLSKKRKASPERSAENTNNFMQEENLNSEDEDFADSSDDEKPWMKEVQKQYRLVKREEKMKEMEEKQESREDAAENKTRPKSFEVKVGVYSGSKYMRQRAKTSLGERLMQEEKFQSSVSGSRGNKQMTFIPGKRNHMPKYKSRQESGNALRPARNLGKSGKRF